MNLIRNIKIQVKIRFKNHILSTFPLLNHCCCFFNYFQGLVHNQQLICISSQFFSSLFIT